MSFVFDNPTLALQSRRTWCAQSKRELKYAVMFMTCDGRELFIKETGSKRSPDSLKSLCKSVSFLRCPPSTRLIRRPAPSHPLFAPCPSHCYAPFFPQPHRVSEEPKRLVVIAAEAERHARTALHTRKIRSRCRCLCPCTRGCSQRKRLSCRSSEISQSRHSSGLSTAVSRQRADAEQSCRSSRSGR